MKAEQDENISTTNLRAINFQVTEKDYQHWKIDLDGEIAWLGLGVNENATLMSGYQLKLNSYDLGVDIELHDAVSRLRFEHPEVKCVILHSLNDKVFCAGANIKMLGLSDHAHKVNFCKFTNETRNAIENATCESSQIYICAVKGSCAGGGYEMALACEKIFMVDDGSSSVSLPELPLLAVLPGTGGLTRLVDKRFVRRDRADFFCTVEEGIRGKKAVDWGLVDEVSPASSFPEDIRKRAKDIAAENQKIVSSSGVSLKPLERKFLDDEIIYSDLEIKINRDAQCAEFFIKSPPKPVPKTLNEIEDLGCNFWPLALARQLDDAILHLRFNEKEVGTWVFRTQGDANYILATEKLLKDFGNHWFIKETVLMIERTFKRLDVTARSLITAIEPGSCFVGFLAELIFVADQSYMLLGQFEFSEKADATIILTDFNFGPCKMVNNITRLESRFFGRDLKLKAIKENCYTPLKAPEAETLELVTFIPDDIDWEDELRMTIESRVGFSPDALSGMEANLRFVGPETIESKIFSRLSAWQNWIFQRPNAVGDKGALVLYGTGERAQFKKERV
jgi:benzoyl-CoA-dihydrodiol lyase